MFFKKNLLFVAAVALLAGACNRDEENVAPVEDNERITTVSLQFTNKANSSDAVVYTLDGLSTDGTQPSSASATISLKPNTAYTMQITLGDKSKTPAVDITSAIRTEGNEHFFVYTPTSGLNMTVKASDQDTNPAPGPYPIGLAADVTTGAASTGRLNVVLRHQPGVKNGTATPGTSDLDVNFNVAIR